ncbi:MAG TPA: hypothetical protein VFN30_04260 [Chitinophagaceae bacterium]|nr:hypothetical protein [Chitinophagaceae bacterium]
MKKSITTGLLFFCAFVGLNAQLNFYFLPEIYGRSVDGLGSFQVQYSGADKLIGRISISVKENRSNTMVVVVTTPEVSFTTGITNFPKAVFNNSTFNFFPNGFGDIANQTRNIPPGEYTYCFRFVPIDKALFDEYENCFDAVIEPLVPLTLLNPAHQDTICIKRPILSWQPPLPLSPGTRFRLLLTEKKDEQAIQSLLTENPTLFLDNISTTTIAYPSINPELKEGKTYCWQVIAYEKGIIISRSEIWEFTVMCQESPKPDIQDSYRELKLLLNGNYYIANRYIKFAFKNDYNINKLRYSISDIEKGGEEIKHIPEIRLQHGLNKITIDLADLYLKPGKHYMLKVYPFNEPPVEVRFIYREDDEIELQ